MNDIFDKFPEIDLGEIVLRELIPTEDSKDFFKYIINKNVSKYTSDNELPSSLISAENDLAYWADLFKYGKSIYWAIADKKTNKMIGSCGFNYWNKQHGRLEISYDLNYTFWGNGFVTKSVNAITDLALKNPSAQRVQATVATDNERSIKVLELCGYKREAILLKYYKLQGIIKDGYMYAKV